MSGYDPEGIELRWQRWWEDNDAFRTGDDRTRPKYYVLDMFPYPSGSGLHVGHPSGYTATDIIARYKRMCGYNVLHPMGWDAFGLPAERAAVREGEHPAALTAKNVDNFRRQIKRLGFSYDWSREINTTDPSYYRWTQWIFLQLHERGLAYRAEVPVNWCPAQGTVLANEEVQDGRYVETGDPVERRMMMQWQLRIPAYAERLLSDLEGLDWPEPIKEMQRNWIGRSEGAEVHFPVTGSNATIEVFTTRPDTLFGATYMVLAPEHPLVDTITTDDQRQAVDAYRIAAGQKTDLQRTDLADDKSGVFTGATAVHPITGESLPIWIAEYVLASYGTGAIMAVPAHDDRDWAFARQHGLPIREVVSGGDIEQAAWTQSGTAVNSDFLNGLETQAAKEAMLDWLEEQDVGRRRVNYRLRDWLFSRQRYWGEPFPVLLNEDGSAEVLPAECLPVELPHLDDFRPTADGDPPLARASSWCQVTDPATGTVRWRETNTMPQWAGSCWYYLRFIDPHNSEALVDPEKERYWMPVDLYVGGAEHAVLHLLYARFWHKVLFDAGIVSTAEPFQKLFNQGMILAHSYKDAAGKYFAPDACEHVEADDAWQVMASGDSVSRQIEKMSKSKYNVVNPDDIVSEFGADSLRLYEMYMGPLEQTKPWQTDGVRGMFRFLARAWRLLTAEGGTVDTRIVDREPTTEEQRWAHLTTRRVTDGIENIRMNTAIAALIEWLHELSRGTDLPRAHAERFAMLLAPFAPHLAEEIWAALGQAPSVGARPWPQVEEAWLKVDVVKVAVQINGKVRATVEVAANADEDAAVRVAMADPKVSRQLEGTAIVRTIWIPGRLLNLIVRPSA